MSMRMRKKGDCVHSMVVGAAQAAPSVSETADFPTQSSLGFTENGPKKERIYIEQQFSG